MREFQERRRLKKFLHSRYAIGVLAIMLILLVRGVWQLYGKYERSKEIAEKAKNDLVAIEERKNMLSRSIGSLQTDEGKEREIWDRFGAVKEGERLVVLVDENQADKTTEPVKKFGFWSRFLGFFGI